jgi:hypothetical protein
MILLANPWAGPSGSRKESEESRVPGRGQGSVRPPITEAAEIEGSGGEDVLEAGLEMAMRVPS